MEGEREEEEERRQVFDPSNEVWDVTEEDNTPEEGLSDRGDSFAEDGAEEISDAQEEGEETDAKEGNVSVAVV